MLDLSPSNSQTGFEITSKVPPQNIECEEQILGGILLDPQALERIAGKISAEAFYIRAHATIFEQMLWLHDQRQPTDLISVAVRLQDVGQLSKVGGQAKLAQLFDRTVSAVNIDRYAALVVDKWLRRRLIEAGYQIDALAHSGHLDIAEIVEEAQKKIFAIGSARPDETGAYAETIVLDVFDMIEQRMNSELPPGELTGFYDFDKMTNGLHPKDLIVIAGRPSMGKTAFATQILYELSKSKPTCFFSLEMSKEALIERLLSLESGVNSQHIQAGRLSENELTDFLDGMPVVQRAKLYIDDRPCPNVSEMASTCRQVAAEHGQLGVIVIDYLQLMCKTDDETKELGQITRALKGLAREMNAPVIVLSQLNRAVENRQCKRPVMSDIRQSGAIEQDADLIAMLYRDEYYNPDTPDRGIAEVIIAKHRNGPTGVTKLLFEKECVRFKNLRI
jgi:replicative DNA helicase